MRRNLAFILFGISDAMQSGCYHLNTLGAKVMPKRSLGERSNVEIDREQGA